jgi:hypothetical protein
MPSKTKKNVAVATIDRRRGKIAKNGERRTEAPRAPAANSGPPMIERRAKVNRRRQIDPTTCERDYSDDEVEFMNALDVYKRKSGRMFPTCSEVLEVIRNLGYIKANSHAAPCSSAEPMRTTNNEPK